MARDFKTIGVVGLGTMGAGITEVFARNGYAVVGVEVDDDARQPRPPAPRALDGARRRARQAERGATQKALHDRVTFATSLEELKDADLVVEAVVESLEIKKQIFKQLDAIVSPDDDPRDQHLVAVGHRDLHGQLPPRAASSACTSSTRRRCRASSRSCAPSSPSPRCSRTSPALVQALGKNPVVCGDKAGFIANTLLFGYLNHAVSMYENRYASREDIDAAMRFGCGYPMGPLALLDLIGLDTAYEILDTMYRQGRDRLHAPAPILKQMVTAGMLGRKTGKGFYTYEGPDSPVVVPDEQTPSADDKPAAQARHQAGRRRRHRHDGDRHRRGLRQGRVRRHLRRPLPGQGRRRRARRSSARSTRRSSAASSRSRPRTTCSAG